MEASELKAAASGRWIEILCSAGIPAELLDTDNHPCPKCKGTDRFAAFKDFDETGGVNCRNCFYEENGDGIAAIGWIKNCGFNGAMKWLSDYLGMNSTNAHYSKNGKAKRKPAKPAKTFATAREAIDAVERYMGPRSALWTYHDAEGEPVGVVLRWDKDGKKTIRPVSRNVDGTWKSGGMPSPRPLYRLPEVLESTGTVYVCEGEKAADAAVSIGLVATASPHGSQSANKADWSPLAGREVVIFPDNDQPGEAYAKVVAGILAKLTPPAIVRVVRLPDLPEKGDIDDFVFLRRAEGKSCDDIFAEVDGLAEAAEVLQRVRDAEKKVDTIEQNDDTRPLTDLGNAERFAADHGLNVRYIYAWRKFLAWDKQRWKVDDSGAIDRLAKRTVRDILLEARSIQDVDRYKAFVSWSIQSESASRIAAMIKLAKSEQPLPTPVESFDTKPWLLNVENGTIDLQTGQLHGHERGDYLTKLCDVTYDPDARCPIWQGFLQHIFRGDTDLIGFVQRLLGYCLAGSVQEQVLPIFYGSGANGKSTLLNAFLGMLGEDFAMQGAADLLMQKRGQHPTELTDLHGMRFVASIETEDGKRLAESLIKMLTGGESIRARRMREDFWQFKPTHKIVLATNHKPAVRGTDFAIWRRLRLVPFDVEIPKKDWDLKLPDKLQVEYPGILAWCVRGCLNWQKEGLGHPEAIEAATAEYRESEDVLGGFLAECCLIDPGYEVQAIKLFHHYQEWCKSAGEYAIKQRRFGQQMTKRGFERFKNNGTWYRGVTTSTFVRSSANNEF